MNNIFEKLPENIVKYILPYDRRFVLKNSHIKLINIILQNDFRYTILKTIKIKKYDDFDNTTYVILNINNNKEFYLYSTYSENIREIGLIHLYGMINILVYLTVT